MKTVKTTLKLALVGIISVGLFACGGGIEAEGVNPDETQTVLLSEAEYQDLVEQGLVEHKPDDTNTPYLWDYGSSGGGCKYPSHHFSCYYPCSYIQIPGGWYKYNCSSQLVCDCSKG